VTPEIIDTAMAKQLIDAQAIRSASIVGQAGGWSVILKLGTVERSLAAQRSKNVRVWRSLDRCVAFMRGELGLAKIDQLDASGYDPEGPARTTRADAADRLKRAHEAAAHDQWFRAQVEEGVRDLHAGRVVTEAAHDQHWAKRRAALQKRIAALKRKA
jgi:hypothetical protein